MPSLCILTRFFIFTFPKTFLIFKRSLFSLLFKQIALLNNPLLGVVPGVGYFS